MIISQETKKLIELQRGLTGLRNLAGSDYMDDDDFLHIYNMYYHHVSMAQVSRVYHKAKLNIKNGSVLDMGAGTGAMSEFFFKAGAKHFTLVDSSIKALKKASSNIAAQDIQLINSDMTNLSFLDNKISSAFDIIIFGHSLNEITGKNVLDKIKMRFKIIQSISKKLKDDGCIIIIEPANTNSSRENLALRDMLVQFGWYVKAPCTCNGPCPTLPLGETYTCHDEAAWTIPPKVEALSKTAKLDRELIKMSWFCFTKQEPIYEQGLHRVISMPMLNKGGRVRYNLCGSINNQKQAERFSFSAKQLDPAAKKAGFFELSRYDALFIDSPEYRTNGLGFVNTTSIKVQS